MKNLPVPTPMRIAFFAVKHIELGGGIEKFTFELGKRLVQRGHDVTVYSMRHYGALPKNVEGMRVIGVPSLHFSFAEKLSASFFAAIRIAGRNAPLFFRSKKYDIVHHHIAASGAFALLSRMSGAKAVLQMHGIDWKRQRWSSFGQWFIRFLERIAVRTATKNAFTAVSQVQCDFYEKLYGVRPHFIPTGCEIKEYVEPQEILKLGLEPKKYILFASRLVAEKGPQYLIPAFRQLTGCCAGGTADYKLVIAGDAKDNEDFKRHLYDLAGNDPRIIFPGFVSGRLLDELFHHATMYVQPSELEGLSIALLEGLGYGIPVLASNIPENIEAVADTGYYFENKSVDDLAQKLRWILENLEEADSLAQTAKQRIMEKFSWNRVTDEFEEFYQKLIGRGSE